MWLTLACQASRSQLAHLYHPVPAFLKHLQHSVRILSSPHISPASESVPLPCRAKAAKSQKLRLQAIPLDIAEKTPGDKDPRDMAWQVKARAAKPDNLTLIPRNHTVKRDNRGLERWFSG